MASRPPNTIIFLFLFCLSIKPRRSVREFPIPTFEDRMGTPTIFFPIIFLHNHQCLLLNDLLFWSRMRDFILLKMKRTPVIYIITHLIWCIKATGFRKSVQGSASFLRKELSEWNHSIEYVY